MILDPFFGAGATARTFLLEPKCRKFTGCDMDSDFSAKVMPSLMHVFLVQILNRESEIAESK